MFFSSPFLGSILTTRGIIQSPTSSFEFPATTFKSCVVRGRRGRQRSCEGFKLGRQGDRNRDSTSKWKQASQSSSSSSSSSKMGERRKFDDESGGKPRESSSSSKFSSDWSGFKGDQKGVQQQQDSLTGEMVVRGIAQPPEAIHTTGFVMVKMSKEENLGIFDQESRRIGTWQEKWGSNRELRR